MFYVITGITLALSIVSLTSSFIVKRFVIKILGIIVNLGLIAYTGYTMFLTPDNIEVDFPIFVIAVPLLFLIINILFIFKDKQKKQNSSSGKISDRSELNEENNIQQTKVLPVHKVDDPLDEVSEISDVVTVLVADVPSPVDEELTSSRTVDPELVVEDIEEEVVVQKEEPPKPSVPQPQTVDGKFKLPF